jgi:hypothetical protein
MLSAFFDENRPRLPGRVLIDGDDNSYRDMQLPAGWDWVVGERGPLTEIINHAFRAFPDEAVYGCVTDDLRFSAAGWDEALTAEAGSRCVAWGDDGVKGDRVCTFFFIGGELVHHMGWLVHPAFGHLYADNVWWHIAKHAGLARYRPDIKVKHLRVLDRTFAERSIAGDRERYAEMKSSGALDGLAQHAKQLCSP